MKNKKLLLGAAGVLLAGTALLAVLWATGSSLSGNLGRVLPAREAAIRESSPSRPEESNARPSSRESAQQEQAIPANEPAPSESVSPLIPTGDEPIQAPVASGDLLISVGSSTPLTTQLVAGALDVPVLALTLTSSSAEDIMVNSLTFRVDKNQHDAAIASATLKLGNSSLGTVQWQDDSTKPGYAEFTLAPGELVVPTASSVNVQLDVSVSSSSEQNVSGKIPKFYLSDLTASGSGTLAASSDSSGLTIQKGIIPKPGGSSTFGNTSKILAAPVTSATMASLALGSGNTSTPAGSFQPGDILFVDENADGQWTPASEELMTFLSQEGSYLVIQRGTFGTQAQSAYSTGKKIYVLNQALTNINGLVGNPMPVYNTKPLFSMASDTPSGITTGGTNKVVYKFNVQAANNPSDYAENAVTLKTVDLTFEKNGVSVNNVKMYPQDFDNNANYVTLCKALNQTKWRCDLSTVGATNQIIESTVKTYTVRADVGSGNKSNNTLDVSIQTFGSPSVAGDVVWSDGLTPNITWANQSGPLKAATSLLFGSFSGTYDAMAPKVTSMVFSEGSSVTNNTLDSNDIITITYSEAIDPTSINAKLVPGGPAIPVNEGENGDVFMLVSGLITVRNVVSTDVTPGVGADSNATKYTNTLSLNATGNVVTVKITGITSGNGKISVNEVFGDIKGFSNVKDVNGNSVFDVNNLNATGNI